MKIRKALFLSLSAATITASSLTATALIIKYKNHIKSVDNVSSTLSNEMAHEFEQEKNVDGSVQINNLEDAITFFNSSFVPSKPSTDNLISLRRDLKNSSLSTTWRFVNSNNIKGMLQTICAENISNENKQWLIYALKQKVATNNFIGHSVATARTVNGPIIPITTDARVDSTKNVDEHGAFGSENLIPLNYLHDSYRRPILINGHKVTEQGETNQWNDWHVFNPDVTIINWSNKEIYQRISERVNLSNDYRTLVETSRKLSEGIELLTEVAKTDRLLQIGEAVSKFKATNIFTTYAPLFEKVNFGFAALNYFSDIATWAGQMPIHDAIEKSVVKNLVPWGVGAITGATLGGPIGAAIGLGVDLILNVIPTPNGATISSNMFDHGLNDFKFQLNHNVDNMLGIAQSFSEDFSHGISWKIEDSLFDTPDLWIRPGQVASEHWQKLSNAFFATPSVIVDSLTSISNFEFKLPATKTFNWGIPVALQGFKDITELRKSYNIPQATDKIVYQDILRVDFYNEHNLIYAEPRNMGVMFAGSNRNYEITFQYVPKSGAPVSFTPSQTVHENDHDHDSSIKHNEWIGKLPSDGIEIDVNNLGSFQITFNDGKVLQLKEMNDMFLKALEKAQEYVKFVLDYGKHPQMPLPGSNENTREINSSASASGGLDTSNFIPFDQAKTYVPRFFIKMLWTQETKFNTYDDSGWDDTHSDNFSFFKPSIGINVEFVEVA